MISWGEAIRILRSSATPLSGEWCSLGNAEGRISFEEILSPKSLPEFNNSSMDGFGYRWKDIEGMSPPLKMKVLGTLAAGDGLPQRVTEPMGAWEIMTGAIVPNDCDSVIRVEDVELNLRNAGFVEFLKSGKFRDNLRMAGADYSVNDEVLGAGIRILPEHLMALSALGISQVNVFRRPKVAFLSTGSELSSEDIIPAGKIRNSTAPYLSSELKRLGCEVSSLGTVKDNLEEFKKKIETQVQAGIDIIISTGAVSMGKHDFVPQALKELGAEILFHKVAIRPGKPLLFAKLGRTAFFGVPGNPISTVVALRFFVEPYLRTLQNLRNEEPQKMKLMVPVKKPQGLKGFFKSNSLAQGPERFVRVLDGQESFRIKSLLEANSWTVLPEHVSELSLGAEVDVYPMHSWNSKEVLS